MAGAATGAKRARAAAFSAHERYMHKSGVVLQREGKKIRAFLVRKVVAQLKQTRDQHTQATEALAATEASDETKRKRAQGKAKKLFHQVKKLETELATLKTLDLKAVVARAFETTGLKDDEPDDESEDDAVEHKRMSAHDREMQKYGRGRVVEDEEEEHRGRDEEEEEDDDDGFNSEDYDEVARSGVSDSESSGEENGGGGSDNEGQEAEGEKEDDDALQVGEAEEVAADTAVFGPQCPPVGHALPATNTNESKEDTLQKITVDPAVTNQLIDRVLAHNQMQPCLDAIRQYVVKKEKDKAKKLRQKEKSALKRARASMIGGRSAAAPTSMFFGSLSGNAPDSDDDAMDGGGNMGGGMGRASMAGADDDIAEFLGETKKKKNRAGQMARRQKAIRLEEARRRDQGGRGDGDVADGFPKRRFGHREAPSIGKYGPSERPKKQQKKDGAAKARDAKRTAPWQDRDARRGSRDAKSVGEDRTRPERRARRDETTTGRERPPPPQRKAAPPVPQRKPEAAPSHPSWLAKQAMKDKMKVDITAFAGKKITFGDD